MKGKEKGKRREASKGKCVSDLETSRAPVDELDGALGLDGGDGGVDILGDDVSAVHHAARHVLAVAGVALREHVGGLEHRVRDLMHRQLLVVRLLRRDDGRVRGKHEVDARIRHQVGLELGQIHVERTVEAQRSGQGRHDLGDESVQVGVGGALDVEVAAAHVVESLIIEAEGAVGVLQECVRREHVIVGLHDSGGDLGSRGHGEGELRFAAIVHGQALQKKGAKTGAGTTTSGMEDHEALETSAVISQLANAVQHEVHDLLADGVVTTSVVVGGILLTRNHLLGMIKLAVGSSADFVAHSGLKIDHDATRNVLAGSSLGEESIEGVIATTCCLVGRHLAIRLDSVLKAVQLPASVAGLNTALADVDRKTLSHFP